MSASAAGSPYAGFWRRVGGLVVDYLVLCVVYFVLFFMMAFAVRAAGATKADAWPGATVVLGYLLVPWLYWALLESSPLQATAGKLLFGMKVTDLTGDPVGFGRASGRYWGHLLSGLSLGVGYAMAVFTERRQTLHDMIAGTLVVKRQFEPRVIAVASPAPRVPAWASVLVVLAVVFFGPFGIGVLAAIAIPAYQSYTIRAQIAEGLNRAVAFESAVARASSGGQPLASISTQSLNLLDVGQSQYVDSIRVQSGIIVITFGGSSNQAIAGRRLLLVPGTDSSNNLVWTCGHAAPPAGVNPVRDDVRDYTTIRDNLLPPACRA